MNKVCSICKTEKPATVEFYHPDKRAKTGCQPECRICWLAKKRARGIPSIEQVKQQRRLVAESKTEKACSICKNIIPMDGFNVSSKHLDGRKSSCRSCEIISAKDKSGTVSAVDKLCQLCKEILPPESFAKSTGWSRDGLASYCKPCLAFRVKSYNDANPEKARATSRKSYSVNRRQRIDYAIKWGRSNPEKMRDISRRSRHKRRVSMMSGNVSKIDRDAWKDTLEMFDNRCAYCLKNGLKLHMDHVIAISRGGDNSPENLVPACMSCNSRKNAKTVFMMAGI